MREYGRRASLAPVVIARIDTEHSYFRFKDSAQELVRGVIAAFWNLVAARVEVRARQQQIEQAEFACDRALARKELGLGLLESESLLPGEPAERTSRRPIRDFFLRR